jgi:putative DNA primase/helicase
LTESYPKQDQTATAEHARGYMEEGNATIPVPLGEKNPNRPNWQNERWTPEDAARLWNNGQGIGILWGEPSGGRIDIDCDWPEARAAAQHIAPPTRTFGRSGSPASHRIYRVSSASTIPATKRFKVPGDGPKRSVVELLSTGAQSLVPPSTHESGERREFYDERPEAVLDGVEISNLAADIATAALLVRNWPGVGARHDYTLAATGYIGRNLPRARAHRIMRAAIAASGDEEAASRIRDVRDTLDKLERGEPTTGGPTLEQLAPGVYDQLRRWHGWQQKPDGARLIDASSSHGPGEPEFTETDLGNARRLVARHGRNIRYCWKWAKWLEWDGKRWKEDDSGAVFRMAKETVASIYQEASEAPNEARRKELAKHAMRSESERLIAAMISLARSEAGIPVHPDELDADPYLLNVQNGTIDLRTGELREHRREALITKIAPVPYDRNATARTWAAFLNRVLPSEELRKFVQRASGYSATGDTSEQCMLIHHGPGANGKSTFQETVATALGDYALRTPTETLLAKRSGSVPNDVARLKGARFVTASETEEGRRLAESLIKDLTGQDTISARFMRAEWFDFKPTHKLQLSTNHKPEIRGTDNAIWRRIRLVPWGVTVPPSEQDKKLPEKLRGELPGVLAWIVRGCLEWQRVGLDPPDVVKVATEGYRAEMDVLGDFLEDRCIVEEHATVPFNDLWKAYRSWCLDTDERGETKKRFGLSLTERGFAAHKGSRGIRIRRGLRLRGEFEPTGAPRGGA